MSPLFHTLRERLIYFNEALETRPRCSGTLTVDRRVTRIRIC